jgi:hypothetical protein
MDVIHPELVHFYISLVDAIFDTGDISKHNIILNEVHVLVITSPIYDNRQKMIGCTIMEIPYIESSHMVIHDD